jgi:hypothetical protein
MGLAALTGALLIAGPLAASAQTTFEDFETVDVSTFDVFAGPDGAGVGIGVGPADGADGTATALSIGINPGSGGFAGFVVPSPSGVTDISGETYLTFFLDPGNAQASNLPLMLEINLHEDTSGDGEYDGAVDDEFQAVYFMEPGDGFTFVQIPLASFTDDNAVTTGADDGFDFSRLAQIVFAIGNLQGDEFTFVMDELVFRDGFVDIDGEVEEFDFFNDEDISDLSVFSQSGAAGIGTTGGVGGGENDALSFGVNPSGAGAFAGFVIPGGDGTVDISDASYLRFFVRAVTLVEANLPLTLEFNLHEDTNGNGTYEGTTEDEYQAVYRMDLTSDYTEVIIPVASFTDDNTAFAGADDGFDFTKLLEIVVAVGGLDPGAPEFALAFDEIGFFDTFMTATSVDEGTGLAGANALGYAYPNPFATTTRFGLVLDRTEAVTVEVFDLLGRRVALLGDGVLTAGETHVFEFDGSGLADGTYLFRASGESFSQTRRVVLIK